MCAVDAEGLPGAETVIEGPTEGGTDTGTEPSLAARASAGSPETAKAAFGGIGGIIGAVLRGLIPGRARRTRRHSTTRRRAGTSRSAGGSGPLLSVRYHDGGSEWVTTRVAYGRQGNRIAVISSADAQWWRHIRTDSPVQVRVRNAWVDGTARLLAHDDPTYTRAVGVFVNDRSRAAAERLGVPMDAGGHLDHGPRQSGDAAVVWIELQGN